METKSNDLLSDNDFSFSDLLQVVSQYRWLVTGIFLFISAASLFITMRMPNIYQANSKIIIEGDKASKDILMLTSQVSSTTINNTVEILKSYPVITSAYEILQNNPEFENFPIGSLERSKAIKSILGGITVAAKRDVDILTVGFESTSPEEAVAVVNSVVQALIQENRQSARLELYSTREFLETQLNNYARQLANAEEELRLYKLEKGISQLDEETKQLIEKSSDLEAEYQQAVTEKEVASKRLDYLRNELGRQDTLLANVNSVIASPMIEQFRGEVVATQTRVAKLLSKPEYSSKHPEIMQLQEELANQKKRLHDEVERLLAVKIGSSDPLQYRSSLVLSIADAEIEFNVANSKTESLQNTMEEYNKKMIILPDTELELARKERFYRLNEKVHSMLVEKYEDAKIMEQAKMGNIRSVEDALLPENPVKPRKMLNMLVGIVLGLALGVGTAFLLHAFDHKIRTLEDIENIVKIPILGTIPHIRILNSNMTEIERKIMISEGTEKRELEILYSQLAGRLVSLYSPKSPVAESYRTLRTNIISKRKDERAETILISSSGPKEGKSTTTANLAITFSQMNAKTLLVDLDLRRPMIHNIFHLERDWGCSDYLMSAGNFDLKSLVKKSGVPNLDVITSGLVPPNPSELISSMRIDEMIRELKTMYDYIILDSPPIIAVTDALILARKVEQFVLIVRNKVTEREAIKRVKVMVNNLNLDFSGIVVNSVANRSFYRGSYSYYNYYYYYYYEDEKGKNDRRKNKFIRKG